MAQGVGGPPVVGPGLEPGRRPSTGRRSTTSARPPSPTTRPRSRPPSHRSSRIGQVVGELAVRMWPPLPTHRSSAAVGIPVGHVEAGHLHTSETLPGHQSTTSRARSSGSTSRSRASCAADRSRGSRRGSSHPAQPAGRVGREQTLSTPRRRSPAPWTGSPAARPARVADAALPVPRPGPGQDRHLHVETAAGQQPQPPAELAGRPAADLAAGLPVGHVRGDRSADQHGLLRSVPPAHRTSARLPRSSTPHC